LQNPFPTTNFLIFYAFFIPEKKKKKIVLLARIAIRRKFFLFVSYIFFSSFSCDAFLFIDGFCLNEQEILRVLANLSGFFAMGFLK
jgi:hypothetical protein